MFNPFNSSQNPHYSYTPTDVSIISSHLSKTLLPDSYTILPVPPSQPNQSLPDFLRDSLQKYLQDPCITFLPVPNHWVLLCFVPQESSHVILCKDPYGISEFCEELRNALERLIPNINFISNESSELSEDSPTVAAILTLQNIKIMTSNLQSNREKFIESFSTFKGFATQDQTDYLRQEEFPKRYREAITNEEDLRNDIKRHHRQELHMIQDLLSNLEFPQGTPLQTQIETPEALIKQQENAIILDLAINMASPPDYSYNYLFVLSQSQQLIALILEKLDLSQSAILYQSENLLEISSQHLATKISQTPKLIITPKSSNKWHELDLQAKRERLCELNPRTPAQFKEITQNPNVQIEASELLKQAIQYHDAELAKSILKAGIKINDGCRFEGVAKVSFQVILQHELDQNPHSESLLKIERLLIKYGCQGKLSDSQDQEQLKLMSYERIINQLAQNNDTEAEVFDEFLRILKSRLMISIIGLQSAASGKVALAKSEILKHIEEHFTEVVLEHVLEEIMHKVPLLGGLVNASLEDTKHHHEVHKLLDKITGCFPDTKSLDRVIGDYSLGVLKYDAEGILAAIGEGEEAKMEKVHKYTEKFLKYFMDGKATKSPKETQRNLGVQIAKDILEDLKIQQKDLKEIEQDFSKRNCEIFGKLVHYLEDVGQCKNLLKTYLPTIEKIYQIDSMPDVKSLIIMTKNHQTIFCFSSTAPRKKDFQAGFYSQALYMDQENQEIGLERLIDEEHAIRLRASQIYVIGYNKTGNYLATELCQQVLLNIGADKIHLYTYQDFNKSILKKASTQLLPGEDLEIPTTASIKDKITLGEKELEVEFTDITRPAMTMSQIMGELAKRESEKLKRLRTYAKAFNNFGLHAKIFENAPLDRDNTVIVKFLQEKGANFNCRDCAGCTPLGYAAMHGHLDIVKSLVELGTDYNAKDHQGASPLSAAAFHGNIDIVKYLVEKGANIETRDKEGDTPLGDAIASGSMSIVKYLLDKGATPFRTIGCKKVPIFESDPRPQVKYFQILRKLKNQSLTFEEYRNFAHETVLKGGNSLYALGTYFVSECIRLELNLRSKHCDLADPERQAWLKYQKKKLIEHLEPFFTGREKLQAYNRAIRLLLGPRASRQKQILAICEDPLYQEDNDFKVLKALVYLNRANSEFITPVQRRSCLETALNIISELRNSMDTPDLWYLEAEYYSVAGQSPEKVREFYEKAVLKDKNFMHPVARMINYHMKNGELEKSQKEFKLLKKQILPVDVEMMLEDIVEVMAAKEFMTLQAQKTLAEQDFSESLREALAIDVKESAGELKKLMPAKLSAKHGSLFKTIDYASSMLQSFWGGFISYGENPETKDHKFFDNINLLIKKLKELKAEAKKTCSVKGSFNGDGQAEARFYEIIQEIIEYYESYINDIVKDCNELHDPNYSKKFNCGRAELFDVNKGIKVTSEKGKKYLLKQLASQYINLEVPKGDQKYGVHKVVVYPRDKDHQVYYKFSPYAPGIEFAVSSLYSQIVPNATPETHLLSVTEGKRTVMYQASKGIIGINFAEVISQQDLIQKIDMKNFSGLLISSLLARPGDAKPDNFVVKFSYDLRGIKSAQLVSVDNDIAFCREKLSVNSKGNTIYSDMLNILYLLPQMDKPISPFIRSYLLQQSPEVVISRWLQSLHSKNLQYLSSGFSTQDLEKALLPIKLPPGTAKRVYLQLSQILALLKSETITHHEIFKAVYPSICDFYKKSRDSVGMVNSLKNLYKAAGADPNLVKLLYSHEKSVSSKAWTTFSMSKRKSKKEFDQAFSQDIVQSAQEFLADIDFTQINNFETLTELGQNLNFLTEIILYKISSAQLQKLCKHMTKLVGVTLINPQDKEESKAWLLKTMKIEPQISLLTGQTPTASAQELLIMSLWDLVDDKKRPEDSILTAESVMQAIKQHSLNINEQDPETKNTVLHQAVLRRDQKLVKILLDCGINYDLKNKEDNTAISLTTIPEIKLIILEHRLDYLWTLVKDGRYEEVKMIAETISGGRLGDYMNHIIEGEPKNLLEISLKGPKLKDLAVVVLNKADNRINDRGLVKICVENYDDREVGLLQMLVDKIEDDIPGLYREEESEESLIKYYTEAANQAYESQKWNMLVFLVNRGCQLSVEEPNIKMVMKAREWGIVIDTTDFKNQFDYTKMDLQGNLIFHMMCEHCDLQVFRYYKDILPRYFNVKNKQGEDLKTLARKKGFIEVLELMYPDQNDEGLYDKEGHIFAHGVTKKLSKILKGYGITITIREALGKIDLNKATETKGNTYLQQVIKRYIRSSADLVKCKGLEDDLKVMLQNGACIQGTKRLDGNSALHLAAKYGQVNLTDSLICYAQMKELDGVNAWQQTALDVADIYGHEETAVVIKNWMKELTETS